MKYSRTVQYSYQKSDGEQSYRVGETTVFSIDFSKAPITSPVIVSSKGCRNANSSMVMIINYNKKRFLTKVVNYEYRMMFREKNVI